MDNKLYSNTEVRALTLNHSETNEAHEIWYSHLTPVQRLDVAERVDKALEGAEKLNACLNYIEDNLAHFKEVIMKKEITALINTSVSDAKISLEGVLRNNPEKAKKLAEGILNKLAGAESQTSRIKMVKTIARKADRALTS